MRFIALAFIASLAASPVVLAAGASQAHFGKFGAGDVAPAEAQLPQFGVHGPFGTEEAGEVITSENLPPWGRHVAQDDVGTVTADETTEAPASDDTVASTDSTVTTGASGTRCEPIAKSPGAVGNPCETTRTFMKSLGLGEAQILSVESIGSTAH